MIIPASPTFPGSRVMKMKQSEREKAVVGKQQRQFYTIVSWRGKMGATKKIGINIKIPSKLVKSDMVKGEGVGFAETWEK